MKFPAMPQPLITHGAAVYPSNPKYEKLFTLQTRYEEEYQLFKKVGDHSILIPRQLCPLGKEDKRVSGLPIEFASHFKPRNDEQARVVKEAAHLLHQGESFIVQAPTGFGKTIVSAEIIGRVGVKTLIIVPKNDITAQWRDALKLVLGLKDDEIGYIQGDNCNVKGKKVVIAMIHSVCKPGRYPAWVYKDFGFIVIDETHVMGAETFSEAMWMFPAKLRMGVSATPYRKDGKDVVFFAHIGQVKVAAHSMTLKPKVIVQRTNFKLPLVKRKMEDGSYKVVKLPIQAGRTQTVNKLLAKDPARNELIVAFIIKAYEKGRNTIFFSDLKEDHLDRIYAMLQKYKVPSRDIAYYVGGLKEKERELAKTKPILLATYQMCSMATDIPWLDTAVLGTPRSDVVQIVGRILREYPDKKEPVVYDLVDADASVFAAYAEKRLEWFRGIGSKIVRV